MSTPDDMAELVELIESIGQLCTPLPNADEHETEVMQRSAAARVVALAPRADDFAAAGYLTRDEVGGLRQIVEALQPLVAEPADAAAQPTGGWPTIHTLADDYLDGDY